MCLTGSWMWRSALHVGRPITHVGLLVIQETRGTSKVILHTTKALVIFRAVGQIRVTTVRFAFTGKWTWKGGKRTWFLVHKSTLYYWCQKRDLWSTFQFVAFSFQNDTKCQNEDFPSNSVFEGNAWEDCIKDILHWWRTWVCMLLSQKYNSHMAVIILPISLLLPFFVLPALW